MMGGGWGCEGMGDGRDGWMVVGGWVGCGWEG